MSCKSAKIMTDPNTGMSRGYGFVRFSDESEQQRALNEMQGVYCGNRPMRISMATPKNKAGGAGGMAGGFYNQPPQQQQPMLNQFNDPNNTTVFVGGLSGVTHEEELRQYFAPFGEITYVKIPPGKGCGFVQFVHRQSAEIAIAQMNGYQIGNSRVRLSWGRSQNDKTQGGMMSAGAFRSPQPGLPYSPLNPASPYPAYPAAHHNYTAPSNVAAVAAMHHVVPVIVDPLEPIPVERMNEAYMNGKEGLLERIETDGTSWRAGGVYAQ
ncbi:hypothetical protein BC936DRAFT_143164 [Jimgerdemannia flammicorona]|uniref:Uncharacterized protein n=2 Tax=Jimgerdemannia flammicorona TaxID=994334 RepID=A0A432ZZD0_9FUNG|nr:hypothetical protein BC936DRAFT_143164 [Jimgerdemannia flammicorona]RUS18564.1 hypothetical protein BC938DRAFT_475944 [Jimgerdemannia flammicorona]